MIRLIDSTGTERQVKRIRVIDDTGTERLIQRVRVVDDTGTTRIVFTPFRVQITPSPVLGSAGTSPQMDITTATTNAVPVGGTGPYTYSWQLLNNFGYANWVINSSTAQSTTFTAQGVYQGSVSATFRVTVTDDNGLTATADVEATVTNTNTS